MGQCRTKLDHARTTLYAQNSLATRHTDQSGQVLQKQADFCEFIDSTH